ncbi:hypothetical protein BAU07_26235 (plasmid) [Bordetella flabilis]|uniref:Thioredoxin-like fold domain-containing protein n=1 Tax=Bordetella flabilis TaxID=463014 RepID=A0A193GMJ9_9BORD|nr:hypothetical protein BAU07_26235 [Bordetella flabilis]
MLVATAIAVLPAAQSVAQSPEAVISRYGKIVRKLDPGVGGLTAWQVEKNGKQITLYTTPPAPNMAVIAGVVWDAQSGRNISDMQLPVLTHESTGSTPPAMGVGTSRASAMSGNFTGDIPQAMHTVDSLQGVKEGQGGVADTVYVVIDPRCPYCQQAYAKTRPYVAKGYSIKWIPTTALGDKANGTPIAATILQSSDPAVLARILGKHEPIKSEPTPETIKALDLNLAFMFAAFEQNQEPGQQAGVPVAFYIDHRTGRPKMMTGLTDDAVLQDIFGSL